MATPDAFITALRQYIGTPYLFGGKTAAGGLDCSGLITLALADVGVPFVHGSAQQIDACRPVTVAEAWNTPGALLYRPGHDAISLGDGRALEAITPAVAITARTDTYQGQPRFTRAGLIPGISYSGDSMAKTAHQIVSAAKGKVGASGWSGLCEAFTRTAFGFPARYASANLAYQASKRDGPVHLSYDAPAGVPVFWDITSGVNAPYDHVAVSIGGGLCVSTSVGPGKTPAVIGIKALTQAWGMKYRGWAEVYHGQRVYGITAPSKTPPAGGSPAPSKPKPKPTDEDWSEMATEKAVEDAAERGTWRALNRQVSIGGATRRRYGKKTAPLYSLIRDGGYALDEARDTPRRVWQYELTVGGATAKAIGRKSITAIMALRYAAGVLFDSRPRFASILNRLKG